MATEELLVEGALGQQAAPVQPVPAAPVRARRRNARGQGARLAAEIVAGAMAIIERTGSDDDVTLRSVAREVGISAPSIYAHFPDREAILWAVAQRVFEGITESIRRATGAPGDTDEVERLVAGCEAYVAYGLEHPEWYRALFARRFPSELIGAPPSAPGQGALLGTPTPLLDDRFPSIGGEAFGLLVDAIERCVAVGASRSTDVFFDATAVWVAMHGLVSLWSTVRDFPWPGTDDFVRRMVLPLAHIDNPRR